MDARARRPGSFDAGPSAASSVFRASAFWPANASASARANCRETRAQPPPPDFSPRATAFRAAATAASGFFAALSADASAP